MIRMWLSAEALAAPKLESVDASAEEQEILRLVDAGDLTAALRLLMRHYGTAVYRYCRETLRDRALADDVHQRVFIEAHRDLPKFARRSSVRTWLFAIARHRVLDAMKSRKRAQAHVDDADTGEVPDPRPRPDERIDDARLRSALVACLEKLGEHIRTAVLLRFQQGFSFEEMAEICGDKPGTLQARVTRALPALRECIESRTGGSV